MADLREPIVQLTAILGNTSHYPDVKMLRYEATGHLGETKANAEIEYKGRVFLVTYFVTDIGATITNA